MKHFIRGYFDGDGSIYESIATSRHTLADGSEKTYFNTNYVISICGIWEFLNKVKEVLKTDTGVNCGIRKHHGMYYLTVHGRKQVKKVFNYLYQDADIFLYRKYRTMSQSIAPSKEKSLEAKSG